MGRPSKLTPPLRDQLLGLLRDGVPQESAAAMLGVGASTLYEWKRRYPEFAEGVEAARSEAEGMYLGVVKRAADRGDWRAAAWWLDRAHPERWSQRRALPSTPPEQVRIVIEDL